MKRLELAGIRFERLLVIERAPRGVVGSKCPTRWKCVCDCGNHTIVTTDHLVRGYTKSCGCLRSEGNHHKHNMCKSQLYNSWRAMKERCRLKTHLHYKNYGGRGIKVCDKWANSFSEFYKWATANGYKEGLTIDRIDVNGNYEPSNCRWTTMKEQAQNKRNHKRIVKGEDQGCAS